MAWLAGEAAALSSLHKVMQKSLFQALLPELLLLHDQHAQDYEERCGSAEVQ